VDIYRQDGLVSAIESVFSYIENIVRRLVRNYYVVGLASIPKPIGVAIFILTHWAVPGLGIVYVRSTPDGQYRVKKLRSGEVFFFPSFPRVPELRNVGRGYADKIYGKYTIDGFVEVNTGDQVVDVGAFVGAFSVAAAARKAEVIGCEPAKDTVAALRRNTERFDSVSVLHQLVSNEDGEKQLDLRADETDHSIISDESEPVIGSETVQSTRIDTLAEKTDLDGIDFLKIDAEGAEPEVISGIGDVVVRKIAVDCGAERRGQSTANRVVTQLEDKSYEVSRRGSIVFGRLGK
jgi:FkbM family methyltransferase